MDYWVPARASPVSRGSLGRDDSPTSARPQGAELGGDQRIVIDGLLEQPGGLREAIDAVGEIVAS